MTHIVLIKAATISVVGDGVLAVVAVVDPSVANLISVAIGAVVTITLGWFGFRTAMSNLNKKVDTISAKTQVIEGHVNSEKTEAQGKIAALRQEVALLREIMADKKETASLLAQSAAIAAPPAPVAIPVTKEPATLKAIEKHTSDTADNTARTESKIDATVQKINEQ